MGTGRTEGGIGRAGTIVLPSGSYGQDGLPDVRMPEAVLRKGLEFLTERVKGNVEIVRDKEEYSDDDDDDDDDGEGKAGFGQGENRGQQYENG